MRYDVVLTTYQTLSGEWADEEGAMKKENAKRKKLGQAPTDSDFSVNTTGPLFESSWYRVILDEARELILNDAALETDQIFLGRIYSKSIYQSFTSCFSN